MTFTTTPTPVGVCQHPGCPIWTPHTIHLGQGVEITATRRA